VEVTVMRLALLPILSAATLLIAYPLPAASQDSEPKCDDQPALLTQLTTWRGGVAAGEIRCLSISLQPGEYMRAIVEVQARPPLTGVTAQLFAPDAATPAVQAVMGNDNRRALSLHSTHGGLHTVVLRDAWTLDRTVDDRIPIRVWIETMEPALLVQARREAVAADARVAWLREHAHGLRTIHPADIDFSDLAPLRKALDGVRIVMLGESSHYAGSDLAAKSRLVRFLHAELGFDVLAMEAGLFGMEAAAEALRAGGEPRASFALGAWPFWAQPAQMQPLIEYVAESMHGPRPLELAGFDVQYVRPGAAERLPAELAAFLREHDIATPLASTNGSVTQVLHDLTMIRYRVGERPLPDATARAEFIAALDDALLHVERIDDREAAFWAQLLKSVRMEARFNFVRADGADLWQAARLRNEGMADNLTWLATERYPGRRIIVWAGSAHLMRLPEIHPAAGEGPSMGMRVSERFGDEMYVIVPSSYEGPIFGADQHALPDFESLMAAAGFDYGFIDLRAAAAAGSWLGGPFLARGVSMAPEERVWSDVADGFLFIRRYEPSRRAIQ
jgi:erythromycin esterase